MRTQLGSVGVLAFFALVASCSSGPPEGTPSGGTGGSGNGTTGGTQGFGGSTSSGGSVSCPTGSMACGTNCIDTRSDNLNCGTCGKACAAGQSCSAGACMCTGGLTACTSGCVSTGSDGNNCGACGTVCAGGQFCSQGKCGTSCATGEMKCDLGCANVTTDSANCGFCGNKCIGGQACVSGACVCPTGQATCNGACTDVMGSTTNCGSCGKACASGQVCSNGVCGGGLGNTGGTTGAGGTGNTGGSAQGGTAGSAQGGAAGSTQGGSAGSAGSAGAGGAVTNTCAKAGMVANFEEGSGAPKVIKQEGRTGEFEIFNDATSTNETMAVEASGGSADCDKWALHVKGGGFTSWGAGVGLSMVGTTKAPSVYNATMNGFTGVRFKAKLGSGSDMKSPVRFNISTPFTESKDNTGGQCDVATLAATTTKAKMDCYQHPGKFLAPGTQLTTSWQTYNFCFDRDLYPLSLPSNMTTEQRNNVGASILKIQFQFNKGKDYSGAYTAMWPTFQPNLPFDFWLDDIEFFKGDCPNMVTSPSTGSPAKAFPQNANLGTCAPATNAKIFNAAIAQAYATWQKNFVQTDRVVAPEQNNDITSEAMGYGMMVAASMGDKTLFDKFWSYVTGQLEGTGLMRWKNGGSGSASDGDTDIAYALYMANKQWPSGGYKTAADKMAGAILSKDIVSNIVRGGSSFPDAPFNPSYFAPAAYRVFAANGASGFTSVISTSFPIVSANVSTTTTGVPTDWADTAGKPSGAGSAQVTSMITDGESGAMGYDSARVPWRLGLDVCLGGGNSTALKQIVDYFAAKYNSGATIDLMKAGWYKRMDAPHPMAKDSQGSYIGPIGVGAMAMNNAAMKDRAFRAILDILESGDFNRTYFPSTVGLLTLLAMSGNFPTP